MAATGEPASTQPALIASGRLNRNMDRTGSPTRHLDDSTWWLISTVLPRATDRLFTPGVVLAFVVNHVRVAATPSYGARPVSDPATARDICGPPRRVLAGNVTVQPAGRPTMVIDVAVRAGLRLAATGPVCRQGDTGPMTPYLPHPALL
jgi:hypothetical protein